jgi:hypothetical protein
LNYFRHFEAVIKKSEWKKLLTESPETVLNFVVKVGKRLEKYPENKEIVLTFKENVKAVSVAETLDPPEEIQNEILVDFAQMLQNESFTDVTFEIDGKTVSANKCVLSCKKI